MPPIPDHDAGNLPLLFMIMKLVSEQLVTNESLPSSQSATKVKVDDVADDVTFASHAIQGLCWAWSSG